MPPNTKPSFGPSSQKKNIILPIVIGGVVLLGIIIFSFMNYKGINPLSSSDFEKVKGVDITPYDKGTDIQVYESIPAGFPGELKVDPASVLTDSSVVTFSDGKENITVAFDSKKSVATLYEAYMSYFKSPMISVSNVWRVVYSEKKEVSVIIADGKFGQLTISLAPVSKTNTRATLVLKK